MMWKLPILLQLKLCLGGVFWPDILTGEIIKYRTSAYFNGQSPAIVGQRKPWLAVVRTLHRAVVVKRELSQKARLSVYRSIFVPTLTYGHELWVVTERTRSRIQAAEMGFLRRVAGLSLRDRVRSSVIRERLKVEPLLLRIERSQLRWFGHLVRMPPGRLPGEVFWACPTGRRPRGRPRTRWRDYISRLAWERLGVLPEELVEVAEGREVWASLLKLLPPWPDFG